MNFQINITPSAGEDLTHLQLYEQKIIVDAVKTYLAVNANVETKRRKRLQLNELAPWELRIGKYRVFYDFEDESLVRIVAVGYKHHNDLYIRGKKVEI